MADDRRISFESVVLRGLWLLLLFAAGGRPKVQAANWRADAVGYCDIYGNQSDGAKEYRRGDHGFPPMYLP